MALPLFKKTTPPAPDGQMELMEHLAELRSRLFRSVAYIAVGMCITYNLIPYMFDFLIQAR